MAGFHLDDTIAAVSTAMAPAGIGIVRISGNDAFEVADRVFRAKKEGKKLSAVKSHTIHYGWITEGEEVIDEVLVMVMKGPKTYTGENTVEIDCHGGVLAVKKSARGSLKCRCAGSRSGRVYETGVSERKDGSDAGRGGYGCHLGKECVCLKKLREPAARNGEKGDPGNSREADL